MINDITDIKTKNIKDILHIVRFSDELTKKDIANKTNLSFATVSNLCNELKEKGILGDEKQDGFRVGRTPNIVSFNFEKYCAICLDLQLENVFRYAILDFRNNILCHETHDISHIKDPYEIILFAKKTIDQTIEKYRLRNKQIIGVGVAVPAVFDLIDGKLINSSVRIYEGVPLKKMVSDIFGLPVYMDNIVNFYALSIHTKYPNITNIVCIDISQGVGVGVISENNLVRGKNGYGAEVAHIPIGNPNHQCAFCGGFGCIETDLSISGMLNNYYNKDIDKTTIYRWNKFIHMMQTDSQEAEAAAKEIGNQVGKLATIMINLFDPTFINIGGYISDIYPQIEQYVMNEIFIRCPKSIERDLEIRCDKNDSENIFIGICDAIYNEWNPLANVK